MRVSCYITDEKSLSESIAQLNSNGWYVESGRTCNKINEIALQCVYVGYKAKETQSKNVVKIS